MVHRLGENTTVHRLEGNTMVHHQIEGSRHMEVHRLAENRRIMAHLQMYPTADLLLDETPVNRPTAPHLLTTVILLATHHTTTMVITLRHLRWTTTRTTPMTKTRLRTARRPALTPVVIRIIRMLHHSQIWARKRLLHRQAQLTATTHRVGHHTVVDNTHTVPHRRMFHMLERASPVLHPRRGMN